ncbi:MAG: alpha-amylase family glycosyl hydrolase, partial [Janthinobacterium lividum]
MKFISRIITVSLLAVVFSLHVFAQNSSVKTVRALPNQADSKPYGKPFAHVPDRRDVTLYQVNMRAFSKDGNFKGVIARLDSIKALGANVVYLLPIYPVGVLKTSNSPYCVRDYLGINTEFGT